MAGGDIYELVDHQTLFSQNCENVFFYRQDLEFVTTDPTNAQVLAENWIAQKLDRIRGIQSNDLLHVGVDVRNLFDVSDAYTVSISLAGTAAGTDTLGSFEAWSYPLEGTNPAVRNGFKRIAGVGEQWQTDGVFSGDGTQIAAMDAAGDAMTEFVTVGLVIPDNVFKPVIVKRVRSGVAGSYTYDLPTSEGAAVWSQIAVAAWKLLITSQISRKIGIGI